MADQTTANIRIVLEDASEGGAVPPPTAGRAAAPVKSPDDVTKSIPMWVEPERRETQPQRRQQPGRDGGDDDGRAAKSRYHEAQQMIGGLSRGMYFAEHFGMSGMVGAAGQWLEAGQSGLKLAGAGATADAIAGPVGVTIAALGAFALIVDKAAAGLSRMADRAEALSADVAGAKAMSIVMRTQFELEQANRYGPMLAKFEVEQTKVGIEWQRTLSTFLDANAEWIMTTLQGARVALIAIQNISWLEWITNPQKVWEEFKKAAEEVVNENDSVITIRDHLEAMREATAKMANNEVDANPADEWMAKEPHFELNLAKLGNINAVLENQGDGEGIIAAGRIMP